MVGEPRAGNGSVENLERKMMLAMVYCCMFAYDVLLVTHIEALDG